MVTPSSRRFRPRHCRLLLCRRLPPRLRRRQALALERIQLSGIFCMLVACPDGTLGTMWQRDRSQDCWKRSLVGSTGQIRLGILQVRILIPMP